MIFRLTPREAKADFLREICFFFINSLTRIAIRPQL